MMKNKTASLPNAADRLLCRPSFGIPFFFAVLALVFFLSFHGPGDMLSRFLETVLLRRGKNAAALLLGLGVSELAVQYWIEGVYTAVASTLAFLPQTAVFFLLVRALRDCGYLARASLVTDRFFRLFGLSGRAVIPLLLGYGCAVSAACACDKDSKEDSAVICALPFVPCNARLPVLLFLADSFFPDYKIPFCVFVYALSFILIFLTCLITSRRCRRDPVRTAPLPEYRLPMLRDLWDETKKTSLEYLVRAGTSVGLCGAVFFALGMLTPELLPAGEISQSLLYVLSERLAPVFRPLGFGSAEAAAALIFGFFAKENMIWVFLLPSAKDPRALFSPAAAVSFTVFSVFYAPCLPLLLAVSRKSGILTSLKLFLRTFFFSYTVSLILYTLTHILVAHC